MTIQEAEQLKQRLEEILNEQTKDGLNNIEVFVAPASQQEFNSFQKRWRNSTFVVALTTFAHADMNVYVCDKNYEGNSKEFEAYPDFLKRMKLSGL